MTEYRTVVSRQIGERVRGERDGARAGTGRAGTESEGRAMTSQDIEFGLDPFVPISVDESGQELSGDVVIRNTVEEAVLADAVGSIRSTSPSITART